MRPLERTSLWHINTLKRTLLSHKVISQWLRWHRGVLTELISCWSSLPAFMFILLLNPFCLFKLWPGWTFIYANKTLNSTSALGAGFSSHSWNQTPCFTSQEVGRKQGVCFYLRVPIISWIHLGFEFVCMCPVSVSVCNYDSFFWASCTDITFRHFSVWLILFHVSSVCNVQHIPTYSTDIVYLMF